MRPTQTISGSKALKKIQQGVNAIYNPVRATFGPNGKSALLYRTMNRGNRLTDDGVTVAECQEPKDQFVRMAAQTFKEMCKRTVEKVGDGFKELEGMSIKITDNREGKNIVITYPFNGKQESLVVDDKLLQDIIDELILKNQSPSTLQLQLAIEDSYKRLLNPAISNETLQEAKAKADR